ncbi:receptor accessory protein 4 [Entomortierella chlamydospora]|nr:receptor accessory protein 4 [Entomortierella chlamydospora]
MVSTIAGSVYPAYASYKAINSRNSTRLTAWLMYWTVMGLFTLVELFLDTFIFWFPFYYEIKLLFVLWMILPQTQGSIYLYQTFVDPYLAQHENDIDRALKDMQKQAMDMGMQYIKQAIQLIQNLVLDLYKKSLNQTGTSSVAEDKSAASLTAQSASVTSEATTAGETTNTNASSTQTYFSWAYHALSPKLSAVATMASEAALRQMPAVGRPPVSGSSTDSTSSKEPPVSVNGESIFGIATTTSDSISPSEKAELEQLRYRLNKASESTGSGSLRYRKISLYEDDDGGNSPTGSTNN